MEIPIYITEMNNFVKSAALIRSRENSLYKNLGRDLVTKKLLDMVKPRSINGSGSRSMSS
jgi:hypothetical protein